MSLIIIVPSKHLELSFKNRIQSTIDVCFLKKQHQKKGLTESMA